MTHFPVKITLHIILECVSNFSWDEYGTAWSNGCMLIILLPTSSILGQCMPLSLHIFNLFILSYFMFHSCLRTYVFFLLLGVCNCMIASYSVISPHVLYHNLNCFANSLLILHLSTVRDYPTANPFWYWVIVHQRANRIDSFLPSETN